MIIRLTENVFTRDAAMSLVVSVAGKSARKVRCARTFKSQPSQDMAEAVVTAEEKTLPSLNVAQICCRFWA